MYTLTPNTLVGAGFYAQLMAKLAFFVGIAVLSGAAHSFNLPNPARPIDDFLGVDGLAAVTTLRDTFRTRQAHDQTNFALGRALFTIGELPPLGLNLNLNSFDVSTLERPLGGEFTVFEERPLPALPRTQRANRRLDGVRWLEPM